MSLNGVECIIGEKEGECKSYFKALINQKLKKKKKLFSNVISSRNKLN